MSTNHKYYILNKPYGYISQFTSNQKHAHKKKYLGELYNFPENVMAIGRLDEASEGLLLLTTNGQMSELVRSRKIEKEYWAQVDGVIGDDAINSLAEGIFIKVNGNNYKTSPAKVKRISSPEFLQKRSKKIRAEKHGPTSWISITITEGKFRQVRKMTSAIGYPTLRLIRVRIGMIRLGRMHTGQCIEKKELTV